MKVVYGNSIQSVECRICHEQIPAEEVKAKLIPVRDNERWFYYYHRQCFPESVADVVQEVFRQADVVIYLVDSSKGLSDADRLNREQLAGPELQLVYSKCDLTGADQQTAANGLYISTRLGTGMDLLIQRITGQISDYNQNNQAFMARRSHVDALFRARDCVRQAADTFSTTRSGELMAEDLRSAQRYLNEITGEFTSDDLLGRIFSSFCIGK